MSQTEPTALRRIPLDALHREQGARMGPFAGFDMPVQYPAGLKAEHARTRESAGLFDVSHMGQIRVTATSRAALQAGLEAALPVDFDGWPAGLQRYSYLLNDQGGIEDDLMLVNLGDEVRMVVNAGNRDADMALLRRLAPALHFEWIDAALVALQGPAAVEVLATLDARAHEPAFMQATTLNLLGTACFATRSGYTGEDGYEISLPLTPGEDGMPAAERIVRHLLADARVAPVGLGARDTLRLEAGLPLHGADILPGVTPVEAGLSFAIPKSRRTGGAKAGGFPGAAVVLAQIEAGPPRRLTALRSEDAVPIRAHSVIVTETGDSVGEVTSGTVSPSLGKPVMLALLDGAAARSDMPLFARVRDKRLPVQRSTLPFVPKRYKR